jgi:hypothetical protein
MNRIKTLSDGVTEHTFSDCLYGDPTANGIAIPQAQWMICQTISRNDEVIASAIISITAANKIVDALKKIGFKVIERNF